MLPTLRSYQEEAVDSLFNYFNEGNVGNPVVAMPCGTGKSWVIAGFLERAFSMFPYQRVIMSAPTKELILQNAEKLLQIWPNAPMGIHSAGLNQRDIAHSIIFGGMQSIIKSVSSFGHRDLLVVDEAHQVSPKENTTYQEIVRQLLDINPNLKVIGLTATNYRMGQGLLTDDGIFTHTCFDITGVEAFNRLLAEGYLCPLVPKRTEVYIDRDSLHMVNGDFAKGESDEAADRIMYAALKEACEQGYDKKSWLIFTAGVKSADHAAEILNSFGVNAAAVHSKIPATLRDSRIRDFKLGKIKALCGMGIFLTGFDHPPVDLIINLRPTVSPALHVQMLGRGMRPAEGKEYCLVLDYAGNVKSLGPINDPIIPRKKGKGTGEAPIRICEDCGTYNHASARFCCNPECKKEFKFETKLMPSAFTDAILRSDAPVIEHFNVDRVIYHRHEKPGMPPSIRVSYYSGLRRFNEFVCLQHSGFAKRRAREWWAQRHSTPPPEFTDDALSYVAQLRTPSKIRVWTNRKFPEILGVEW